MPVGKETIQRHSGSVSGRQCLPYIRMAEVWPSSVFPGEKWNIASAECRSTGFRAEKPIFAKGKAGKTTVISRVFGAETTVFVAGSREIRQLIADWKHQAKTWVIGDNDGAVQAGAKKLIKKPLQLILEFVLSTSSQR